MLQQSRILLKGNGPCDDVDDWERQRGSSVGCFRLGGGDAEILHYFELLVHRFAGGKFGRTFAPEANGTKWDGLAVCGQATGAI